MLQLLNWRISLFIRLQHLRNVVVWPSGVRCWLRRQSFRCRGFESHRCHEDLNTRITLWKNCFYLIKFLIIRGGASAQFKEKTSVVVWPRSLRLWFQVPVISMTWVRIPPLPVSGIFFPKLKYKSKFQSFIILNCISECARVPYQQL